MSGAAEHVRAALARVDALPADAAVPSPCNDVCRVDGATGLCEGCLRTLDEIASWGGLGDDGRRAVWQRLRVRAAALTPALSQGEREQQPAGPRS